MFLFRKSSLGGQVTWRVALLSGIAISGLVTSILVTATVAILEMQNATHDASEQVIQSLERFLIGIETDLYVTASSYSHTTSPDSLLRNTLERNPAVLHIGIMGENGDLLHARQRVSEVDEAVLLEAADRAEATGWGDVYTTEDNLPLIDITLPFDDAPDSEPASALMIATIDLAGFWDDVRKVSFSGGGYAYLVDQDYRLLVSPNITQVQAGADVPPYDFNGNEQTGPLLFSQKIHRGLNGDQVFVSIEPLNTVPWYLVMEQPVLRALSGLYVIMALTGALIVVIILVVASTGRFMFQRVVQPLNILRVYVEQFQMGNLDQRIYISRESKDEIDVLASTFNTMANNIEAQTQELLVARAEALESSRLKSEFLSTISHELRTPLNAIIGYCDLLLEGMAGEFDGETRRMLQSVDTSSGRLLRLIDDLLDLSRIESGQLDMELIPFEVRELVKGIHDEHVLVAEKKGLKFTIIIDTALPQQMYGDPDRIKQIASNLITNAIKFTDEGEVTVTLQRIKAEWLIRVEDTGIGIPEHSRQYIFDAFRQVDNSTTRVHGGTGLGLSIVRNLTTLMGGRAIVESEVGVGSTFIVTLPLITHSTDMPVPGTAPQHM